MMKEEVVIEHDLWWNNFSRREWFVCRLFTVPDRDFNVRWKDTIYAL